MAGNEPKAVTSKGRIQRKSRVKKKFTIDYLRNHLLEKDGL